ncbi:MAG: hypothetical protein ACYC49_00340 [Ignavibacteriaceae bacterium]
MLHKIIEFLGYVPFELPQETIGNKVKTYRNEHGLRQRKLAKLWNVDPTTARDWEGKNTNPIKNCLIKFLDY